MTRVLLVFLLLTGVSNANPSLPLSLPWDTDISSEYTKHPGYRHMMGSRSSGESVFTGFFLGAESELQVTFHGKRISSAILILGPDGIDSTNCIKFFRKVNSILTHKYGKPKYTKVLENDLMHDLIYSDHCSPIRADLYSKTVLRETHRFLISASLFGDGEDIYVEIVYIDKKKEKEKKKSDRSRLRQML